MVTYFVLLIFIASACNFYFANIAKYMLNPLAKKYMFNRSFIHLKQPELANVTK